MLLASYDFEVRHVAGKDNETADTLSRLVASARPRRRNVRNPLLQRDDMVFINDNDDMFEVGDASASSDELEAPESPESGLGEAGAEEITERARAVRERCDRR